MVRQTFTNWHSVLEWRYTRAVVTDRAQRKAACVTQNTDYCRINGAHRVGSQRVVLRNYPDVRRRSATACYLRSSRANGLRDQFIFDRLPPRCISSRQRGGAAVWFIGNYTGKYFSIAPDKVPRSSDLTGVYFVGLATGLSRPLQSPILTLRRDW